MRCGRRMLEWMDQESNLTFGTRRNQNNVYTTPTHTQSRLYISLVVVVVVVLQCCLWCCFLCCCWFCTKTGFSSPSVSCHQQSDREKGKFLYIFKLYFRTRWGRYIIHACAWLTLSFSLMIETQMWIHPYIPPGIFTCMHRSWPCEDADGRPNPVLAAVPVGDNNATKHEMEKGKRWVAVQASRPASNDMS
jgi:hypothetical protein